MQGALGLPERVGVWVTSLLSLDGRIGEWAQMTPVDG
jgi:hypothetical protein